MGKLKYAVAGFGVHGRRHAIETKWFPGLRGKFQFLGAYDPDLSIHKIIQKLNGIAVESFEDLLDIKGLEAIIIASPPRYHADQAVAALEAGLDVYSEVPMALTQDDVLSIRNAEETSGKTYQLGENYCFFPEVLYAAQLSSSGKLGSMVHGECEFLIDETKKYWLIGGMGGKRKLNRKVEWFSEFNPLMYGHSIGPLQVAMGGLENPMCFVEVTAMGTRAGDSEIEPVFDHVFPFHEALFTTESGAIGRCVNAYIYHWRRSKKILHLIGKLGSYECNKIGGSGKLKLTKMEGGTESPRIKYKEHRIGQLKLWGAVKPVLGNYYGANTRIKEDWFTAIRNGKKPSLNATVASNICLAGIAASESAEKGKRIKIDIIQD
jgi:predicted dehydrogenase